MLRFSTTSIISSLPVYLLCGSQLWTKNILKRNSLVILSTIELVSGMKNLTSGFSGGGLYMESYKVYASYLYASLL